MDFSFLSGVFANPWNIFRNLLDIFIVAYIIYRLLGLIQGTRAVQLLKGLIFLLVFSVLVSYLQLDMISWLLEKLWIIFAITLPIVFQPELRRILEQLGQGNFFKSSHSGFDPESYQVIIAELGEAVESLSRNRVGALIIFSRKTGIEEYLESGIMMDSLVSAGLLINTFMPNTPLHDGALIIREGRIYKAACVLPLSKNPELPKELGTRHRAGLGISEVSDVLAVIVSEETGAVSLCKDGRLLRYLDVQQLKEMLKKELILEEDKKLSLWRRWSKA